jgi:tetratricopeptide (TPR) repeat protein
MAHRLAEAYVCHGEAVEIAREVKNHESEGHSLGVMGQIRVEQGEYEEALVLLAQALTIAQELGIDRSEGLWSMTMGRTHRLRGDQNEAWKLQDRAIEISQRLELLDTLAEGLCERGHLQLAEEKPADEALVQAEAIATQLSSGVPMSLTQAIQRLKRAIDASKRGDKLHHGEKFDDLPGSP